MRAKPTTDGDTIGQAVIDRIRRAVGEVPRVAYEAAHVYPLSAPDFTQCEAATRPFPGSGAVKLYAHVPFCNYACNFCFYAKNVGASYERMSRYVSALLAELEIAPLGTPLAQLYVGGGTPTVLPADLLARLLDGIHARLPSTPQTSTTVETSPESLREDHVEAFARCGVRRVSLGVQTLDEGVLQTIQRRHEPRQAIAACKRLVDAGFFVNVDLMYALSGQSEQSFRADLAALAAYRPDSFTLYDVRLNERTPLARRAGDDAALDLARLIRWRSVVLRATRELGYSQTRWHTFVRDGVRPSTYDRAPCTDGFRGARQLGIGVSAVSHLGDVVYRNEPRLDAYMERIEGGRSPATALFPVRAEDERTLFVVRTLGDGAALARGVYQEAFGEPIEEHFGAVIARLTEAGLLRDEDGRLSLSDSGRLVYDLVTVQFYPERARRWLAERQAWSGGSAAAGGGEDSLGSGEEARTASA